MGAIEEAAGLIRKRLGEVEAERAELERALKSLTRGGGSTTAAGRAPARRRTTRRSTKARPKARPRAKARAAQRAAPGKRQEQFLAAVRASPNAKMAEIAKRIGVRPQQLYPIARRLTADGAIAKRGDGWVISADGASPEPKPKRAAPKPRRKRAAAPARSSG